MALRRRDDTEVSAEARAKAAKLAKLQRAATAYDVLSTTAATAGGMAGQPVRTGPNPYRTTSNLTPQQEATALGEMYRALKDVDKYDMELRKAAIQGGSNQASAAMRLIGALATARAREYASNVTAQGAIKARELDRDAQIYNTLATQLEKSGPRMLSEASRARLPELYGYFNKGQLTDLAGANTALRAVLKKIPYEERVAFMDAAQQDQNIGVSLYQVGTGQVKDPTGQLVPLSSENKSAVLSPASAQFVGLMTPALSDFERREQEKQGYLQEMEQRASTHYGVGGVDKDMEELFHLGLEGLKTGDWSKLTGVAPGAPGQGGAPGSAMVSTETGESGSPYAADTRQKILDEIERLKTRTDPPAVMLRKELLAEPSFQAWTKSKGYDTADDATKLDMFVKAMRASTAHGNAEARATRDVNIVTGAEPAGPLDIAMALPRTALRTVFHPVAEAKGIAKAIRGERAPKEPEGGAVLTQGAQAAGSKAPEGEESKPGTVPDGAPEEEAPIAPAPEKATAYRDIADTDDAGKPTGWVFRQHPDGKIDLIASPRDKAVSESNPKPIADEKQRAAVEAKIGAYSESREGQHAAAAEKEAALEPGLASIGLGREEEAAAIEEPPAAPTTPEEEEPPKPTLGQRAKALLGSLVGGGGKEAAQPEEPSAAKARREAETKEAAALREKAAGLSEPKGELAAPAMERPEGSERRRALLLAGEPASPFGMPDYAAVLADERRRKLLESLGTE